MAKKSSKIPEFKTVEEEALFWDTHSPLDFPDEWEDVTDKVQFTFKRRKDKIMPVRFDKETGQKIEKLAVDYGVGATTLVRIWAMEKLRWLEGRGKI